MSGVHCGAHFAKLAAKDNCDASVFTQSAFVQIKKVDRLFGVTLNFNDKFADFSAPLDGESDDGHSIYS